MRILKKISALLLTVTLVLSLAPFAAVAAEGITLTSIGQIATETPAGSGNWVMNADVTVSSNTPIAFSGTLNGNGHTISGLTNTLFANPSSDVTVKNLTVEVSMDLSDSSTDDAMSTPDAVFFREVLTNSIVTFENVTLNGSFKGFKYVGGFVGKVEGKLVVKNCVNNATISAGSHSVGSLVGIVKNCEVDGYTNNGAVTGGNSRVGGVIGSLNGGTVTLTNVKNAATITGNNNSGNGGIIGFVNAAVALTITNTINNGNVANGGAGSAGILGDVEAEGNTVTILNTENTGNVTSTNDRIGGIVGFVNKTTSLTVNNTVNSGDITGGYYVGGVVGSFEAVGTNAIALANVINNGAIEATKSGAGGIFGCFKSNNTNLTISKATNNGAVTVSGTAATNSNAGGILGVAETPTDTTAKGTSNVKITRAVNNGAVTASKDRAGGIVGSMEMNFVLNLTVTESVNTANIKSNTGKNIGGIAGWVQLQGVGDSIMTLTDVANMGDICFHDQSWANNAANSAGAIVGNAAAQYNRVTRAFNSGKVYTDNSLGAAQCGGLAGERGSGHLYLTDCVQANTSETINTNGHPNGYESTHYHIEGVTATYSATATHQPLDLAALNAEEALADFRKVFGNFVEVNGEITIGDTYKSWNDQANAAAVKVRGVQKGLDGTSVRLIAEVKGLNYSSAGFKVTLSYTGATSDEKEITVNYAYTALYAEGSKLLVQPTEAGNYLIALVITDIDATAMQSLNVTFTPFAQANGANDPAYGETVVYNVAAGTVTLAD